MAVVKTTSVSAETVGHIPRCISAVCSSFLRRGGEIHCTVTGSRRYSRDLPQGGLKVPCTLSFMDDNKELKKLKTYFKKAPFLSKDEKKMVLQVSTDKEANGSLNDRVSHSSSCSSNKDVFIGDSVGSSVFSCEKETTALLLNDSKTVEHKFTAANADEPSSNNLDSPDVEEHAKAKNFSELATIVLNDQNEVTDTSLNHSAIWVTFERCTLLVDDKVIIETGKQLSDKHINFAQRMIKNQFPSVGGLKSTLLQTRKVKGQRTANSIQIVHCKKREHGVVVSTKWSKNSQVTVYDSIFTKLDGESRRTILHMFGLKIAMI